MLFKLGLLNTLKKSQRNLKFTFSCMVVVLASARFDSANPGPRNLLFSSLPSSPRSGTLYWVGREHPV